MLKSEIYEMTPMNIIKYPLMELNETNLLMLIFSFLFMKQNKTRMKHDIVISPNLPSKVSAESSKACSGPSICLYE